MQEDNRGKRHKKRNRFIDDIAAVDEDEEEEEDEVLVCFSVLSHNLLDFRLAQHVNTLKASIIPPNVILCCVEAQGLYSYMSHTTAVAVTCLLQAANGTCAYRMHKVPCKGRLGCRLHLQLRLGCLCKHTCMPMVSLRQNHIGQLHNHCTSRSP